LIFSLYLDELKREREFYKARNMPCPKDLPQVPDNDEALEKLNEAHQENDYHRQDEQVNVCLECISNNLKHLKRRFIRCSSQATITHLKKFIAKKVLNGMDKYRDVRIVPHWFYKFSI
jgi:polycomb group RING finger protein 3